MTEAISAASTNPVTKAEIDTYQQDGVVCLRSAFDAHWIAEMRSAFDLAKRERGPLAQSYRSDTAKGEFFFDVDVWTRLAAFHKFVYESPAAEIAARLMQSSQTNFFYDQVFIKEPGMAASTPWHQDQPYWQVDGFDVCSVWLPLDPVPKATAVEFIRGSQRSKVLYSPVEFSEGNAAYDASMPAVPDIEGNREQYDIVSCDVEPGDCLVFQAMILHGAPAGLQTGRRRALATRWCGDDARFIVRDNKTNIPTSDPGLKPGDAMQADMFPRIWPRGE